jgi:hypothetical protein
LDNVHETGGELGIGTDLAINLDRQGSGNYLETTPDQD